MSIEQMRVYISEHPKYKSPGWRDRCNRMPDAQVIAIYNNFRKLDYRKIERDMKRTQKNNEKFHQMDIFEYMEGIAHERHEVGIG